MTFLVRLKPTSSGEPVQRRETRVLFRRAQAEVRVAGPEREARRSEAQGRSQEAELRLPVQVPVYRHVAAPADVEGAQPRPQRVAVAALVLPLPAGPAVRVAEVVRPRLRGRVPAHRRTKRPRW